MLPVVLTIPEMVKSAADVPSSATVKVLVVAFVKATGLEMDAPTFPVPLLITVTSPPSVRSPVPERVAPFERHPPSRLMADGEAMVNPPLASSAPS